MSKDLLMVNAFDPSRTSGLSEQEQTLIARRARLLGPAYRLFYEHPLHIVKGEGVWVHDTHGRKYLDAYNNVPSVGHCHPRVVEAVSRQMATLNTHTRYLHDGILDYAEMLLATFPAELSQVMFTCTGSEANDLAVRVAKSATGGTGFIVTELAYHGVTETIAAMSPSLGPTVARSPHVYTVRAPLSPTGSRQGTDIATRFMEDVVAALDDMKAKGIKPAGLLIDTIFSSDGVISDPAGFLAPAVQAIRDAGGLFIADEVQAGFGRTGEAFWGFQRHGLIPDLVTMGKPMGAGYPVAAMVARPHLLEEFGRKVRYFNTFGGSTAAIAAARAVLDIIRDERLTENAAMTGAYMRDGLIALARRHAIIGDVRGAGLFIGVEIVSTTDPSQPDPAKTAQIVNGLRENGVLISASGPHANVLKVRPPLPFVRSEADIFLAALGHVLSTR
jgi:4-aminobutyrate aminotransferase-like enzyme